MDGKEADGSLGFYTKNSACVRCVIELKDAQCNLDAKQQSRENKQTPVEQAFQYLYKFADCDWVIVSNFRYTRLYHRLLEKVITRFALLFIKNGVVLFAFLFI